MSDPDAKAKTLLQRGRAVEELVDVMDRLLAPDGCPWDREQTYDTLKPYLIEEAYEVLEAIEDGDPREHCDELGDLLLQIVFQAALRAREGAFGMDDVARAIVAKLVRRHPHVFGDAKVADSAQVLDQWAELKAKERAAKAASDGAGAKPKRLLDGVPKNLPSLLRATRISERAASVGFDWPEAAGARAKILEELGELDEILAAQPDDRSAAQAELGDLLYAVVNYGRKLNLDPETALAGTVKKFTQRFEYIEDELAKSGRAPKQSTLPEMDALWERAKLES